jgi:hypothetical protein
MIGLSIVSLLLIAASVVLLILLIKANKNKNKNKNKSTRDSVDQHQQYQSPPQQRGGSENYPMKEQPQREAPITESNPTTTTTTTRQSGQSGSSEPSYLPTQSMYEKTDQTEFAESFI